MKMMKTKLSKTKKSLFILIFAFVCLSLFGQEKPPSELEQLENRLRIARTKEERINANSRLAGYYVEKKDFPKAIYSYEEILKLDENNLNAIEELGTIYQSNEYGANIESKIKKSLPLFLKAEQLGTKNSGTYYDIACIYSLKRDLERSVQYLDKAIYFGFDYIGHIQRDSDLDNIRGTEYYNRLLNHWEKMEQGMIVIGEGRNANKVANYDLALQKFLKADELFTIAFARDSLLVSLTSICVGSVYDLIGEYDKAIEYYKKSLFIMKKNFGDEHSNVSVPYNNLGVVYKTIGEYEFAIDYLKKSLAIKLEKLGADHSDVAQSYNNLASVYYFKGEYDKAIDYHKKSLEIIFKNLGEKHVDAAQSYNNLGLVYKSKGEYDKAIDYYEKSFTILIKALGEDHLKVSTAYNNLGEAYRAKGEYERAMDCHRKSLAIKKKIFGDGHPSVAISYNNLGFVYYFEGQYDNAIDYYEKSLAIMIKKFGANHSKVSIYYNNLGLVYYSKGEHDKAIYFLQKAIATLEKSGDRFNHVIILTSLKDTYKAQSNIPKQIEILKKTIELVLKYRTQMGKDKDYFTQKFLPVFEELIQIYNEQGEYEKAFEISEKMRGLSMMEEINLKYALKSISPPKDSKEYNVFQINTNKFLNLRGQMQGLDSQRVAALNRGDAGKAQLETISKKIMETQSEMDRIEKEFSKKPEYTKLRKFIPPAISEIQKKLKDTNQTFLEFDLIQKDGKEELHVFIISPEGFKHEKWDATGLTDKVKQLRSIISLEPSKRRFARLKDSEKKEKWCRSDACLQIGDGEEYKETILDIQNSFKNDAKLKYIQKVYHRDGTVEKEEANAKMEELLHEVYDLTIKNLVEKKHLKPNSKIVISPDNVLFTIPFSALKNEKGKYAIEEFEISLIHSASIWERLIKNGEVNHTKPFFAMGNSVYSAVHSDSIKNKTGSDLAMYSKFKDSTRSISNTKELDESDFGDLNETLGEIQTVSTLVYKSKDVPEHIYLGIRANKEELYKKFEHPKEIYRSVLFAVHGILNMESPELNSLLLTSRERALRHKTEEEQFKKYEAVNGKLTRDGTFKLGETIELGIKTDLLVMSACETSLGTEKAGEGMVGLPQGFLMGGANNVLATLWSVSSTGTMFFISDFYESYFKTKKNLPANSLQIIQRKFATEKDFKYADPFYWSPFVVYGK